MEFNNFPLEVKQLILNFLPVQDLLQQTLVCRDWNAAIAPLLPQRKVAIRLREGMDQRLLRETKRRYNALKIALLKRRSGMEELYQLFALCVAKFDPKVLHLEVGSAYKLIDFYESFEEVFSRLVELSVRFLPFQPIDLSNRLSNTFDLRLENLQVLRWEEPNTYGCYSKLLNQNDVLFNMFADNLKQAKILLKMHSDGATSDLGSLVLLNSDKLTALEVRLGEKSLNKLLTDNLESLQALKVSDVTQSQLDWNGVFKQLRTLKSLKIHRCHSNVIAASMLHCNELKVCEIVTIAENGSILDLAKSMSSWKQLKSLTITEDNGLGASDVLYEPW